MSVEVEDLALKTLMDQVSRDDTARLRDSIPRRLKDRFVGYRAVVTVLDDVDAIGVAIMSPDVKRPITVAVSKDAFLKDFASCFADMCEAIEGKLKVAAKA